MALSFFLDEVEKRVIIDIFCFIHTHTLLLLSSSTFQPPSRQLNWKKANGLLYLFDRTNGTITITAVIYTTNGGQKKATSGLWAGVVGWLSLNVDKIDAGFKHIDGRVYTFRKEFVYRWSFNAKSPYSPHYPPGQVETGWSKKIKDVFPGVPNDIDTVFRWNYDGNVYFFKDRLFYLWDQKQNKIGHVFQTNLWKNVCDVIKCRKGQKCRSWALNPNNCGTMCGG